MEIEGRVVAERRIAGALLLSKMRVAKRSRIMGERTIGRLGGFDLACRADEALTTGSRSTLVLKRTVYDQEIPVETDLTPLGLIARLEHIRDRFDAELVEQQRRAHDAAGRLADYEARLGEAFPLQNELDDKRAELRRIDAELAESSRTGKSTASGSNGSKVAA